MSKIRTSKEQEMLDSVNNNVDTDNTNDKENTMTNADLIKMVEQLKNEVEELKKPRKRSSRGSEMVKYTISGKIKMEDIDKIRVGEKKRPLPPQAVYSLKGIVRLRDASSGTLTFTRKEWGEATEAEAPDWSIYRQTGERINDWYHHQHTIFQFSEMEVDGEKIFI